MMNKHLRLIVVTYVLTPVLLHAADDESVLVQLVQPQVETGSSGAAASPPTSFFASNFAGTKVTPAFRSAATIWASGKSADTRLKSPRRT